jgi:hypothetical protein
LTHGISSIPERSNSYSKLGWTPPDLYVYFRRTPYRYSYFCTCIRIPRLGHKTQTIYKFRIVCCSIDVYATNFARTNTRRFLAPRPWSPFGIDSKYGASNRRIG